MGAGTRISGRARARLAGVVAASMAAGLLGACGSTERLKAGTYLSPVVKLQQLQGEEDHLHVDEVRLRGDNLLLQCSYTFGVIDVTVPSDMEYLSQNLKHTIPGDERTPGCIHLGWDGDTVYTTHRGNIRNPAFLSGWDITNREAPVQLPVLQEKGISYEGVDVANGNVFVGLHEHGLGVYRRGADGALARVGTAEGLTNAWGVVARGDTVFVADGVGGLATVDVKDPTKPKVLGRVPTGGQARGVVLDGDTAYVASGASGLVVVDVTNLERPRVITQKAMPGTAMQVDYSAGRVFVAAWNDARAYDVSDPASPRFIGSARMTHQLDVPDADRPPATSRVLGIAAKDDVVYVGNWHRVHSYQLFPDRKAPNIRLPESANLIDFGSVKPGQKPVLPFEVTNQGTAPLTLINTWVHGDAFRVTPAKARIDPGESTELSITFEPKTTEREVGYLQILSDDPEAPLRKAYLVGNQPGISVGSQLPETTAVLLDGNTWSSKSASGKVMLLNYFATFCPVCGGELPDVEQRFWQKYRDEGLLVVGLDAHDTTENIGQVHQYCDNLRLTFPLGIEQTQTYKGLTANFAGVNPFPVDIIVGRTGRIEYIAREYDPEAIDAVIRRLLAE